MIRLLPSRFAPSSPATLALALLLSLPQFLEGREGPPNIVLLLIDDLGWRDVGCYGTTFYDTPNVDRLAAEGMRFTSAYAAAPVCSPTRASLLTGRNPARIGFTGHITSIRRYRYPKAGRILPPRDHMRLRLEEVTLAEALTPAGYVSASVGKWHLGPEGFWPTDQGFAVNAGGTTNGAPPSYFFPYQSKRKKRNASIPTLQGGQEGEYLTDRLTDEALDFMRKNQQRPFFLYLTHYAVHTPMAAPAPLVRKYEARLRKDASGKNATYGAMVESVDQSVGRVLDVLDELSLANNTIVIFFSDNGGVQSLTRNDPLRGGKQQLYEGGLRVPLIVRWPEHVRPASISDETVTSDDLFPTLAEIAGVPANPDLSLDGKSLLPVLEESASLPERTLYWYYPHYARRPGAVVREGSLKLIEFYDPPAVELYDLARDIGETRNLADERPEKVRQLRRKLTSWLLEVGATLHTPNPAFSERQRS